MEMTPLMFLMLFLQLAIVGYMVFTSTARLVAWIVSRMVGGNVRFRIAGINGIKEISIDLHKGPVASATISELKVSIRKPPGTTGWNIFSWSSKLQIVVSEVEIVLRKQESTRRTKKNKKHKTNPAGRGVWMLATNIAKYLSVSVNEIVVKAVETSVVTLDIKEMEVDTFRDDAALFSLGVKISLSPIVVYPGEDARLSDASGYSRFQRKSETNGEFYFSLERLCLTAIIDHDREAGMVMKQFGAECGDAILHLSAEAMMPQRPSESLPDSDSQEVLPAERHEPDSDHEARLMVRRIPDAINFSLSKLAIELTGSPEFPSIRNELQGVVLHGTKSQPVDAVGVISMFDIEGDFKEIHVGQQDEKFLLDVATISIHISLQFPAQLIAPLRVEVDVKLLGTKINLDMSKYEDLMQLASFRLPKKKKKNNSTTSSSSSRRVSITWSYSVSAPELEIIFYTLDQKPLMQVISQTSHLYINVIPSQGVVLHAELGEVYLNRIEEGMICTEFVVGVEDCSGCVLHLSRITFDSGVESTGDLPAAIVEAAIAEVYVGVANIKAVLSAVSAIEPFLKNRKSGAPKEKDRRKQGRPIKFQLEQLGFHLEEKMIVEDAIVPDPKKVNFGSQGGIVVITKQDGNLRTARVRSSTGTGSSGAKQKLSIVLAQIVASIEKEKRSTLIEMSSGRVFYEEVAADGKILASKTILAMHSVKLIQKPATLETEAVMHSLLRAENVSIHWDPDLHLFLFEQSLRLKELFRDRAARVPNPKTATATPTRKPKTCYAFDMEDVRIKADLADGVEATVRVQSLFTEDAAVGVLTEKLELGFNRAAIARADRLQVSRIPILATDSKPPLWDIVVHGAGVCIIMPYRLPLRGLDDAVEDTWRALKLAMAAKKNSIRGTEFSKPKDRSSSFPLRALEVHVNGIRAEIEEEPLQGWLDEHYRAMQLQSRTLLVRERLLREAHLRTEQERRKAWEQLQDRSFQEYKKFCSKLNSGIGSGACETGFQSGFRPSAARVSLMSISADRVEFTLTRIKGGRSGMIEAIQRLDCVKPDLKVPFSRLYGGNVEFEIAALAVRIRDYVPMLSATLAKCAGTAIFAQQATCFQKQIVQRIYVGRWRTVEMLRSMPGTTPSYKFYSELPIDLTDAKVSYSVGFEPAFADVSYAFTVALRRTNLGVKQPSLYSPPPVKKERNLPWWDDMRYYVHGFNSINCSGFEWSFAAKTDPYETLNRMQMTATKMVIKQSEGLLSFQGDNFDMNISSLDKQHQFIHSPVFELEISMDWTCESGDSSNHYLHAFPIEQHSREFVYNPFRSVSFSLVWSFILRSEAKNRNGSGSASASSRAAAPYMNLCAQDLIWIFKWWGLYFSPPHKLRTLSRWPRFRVERIPRSGNLSLDKVMTEFILRVDSTPATIHHVSLAEDDPAQGMMFKMQNLRYELCYSRGLQSYTFETKRDILDLVYHGLDIHLLKVKIKALPEIDLQFNPGEPESNDDGFLLSTDCFTMRRQSPKADTTRLSPWRENVQVRSSSRCKRSGSDNSDVTDATSSDPSDDEGLNAVLADNCLRVSLYSLKLFWTVTNRDAVWGWAGDISKAFEAPKPSPSRQYAQRKLVEKQQKASEQESNSTSSLISQEMILARLRENVQEEETLEFLVNVIQPQFNLHSEDAQGRFLLAAASGRVLARSFHSTFYVGLEDLAHQAAAAAGNSSQGSIPELSWKRRELSVLLEHVQAHVAPTDVDPCAGIQWLPRIPKNALKMKRTGPLLERVFLPCSMYFQYIRHKGGSTDCKAQALKDLSFNSPNITATMTSRHFHIMVDVLSNLLFATLPKQRKHEEEEDLVEATYEVVPEGVEEVDREKIKLERAERKVNVVADDLRVVKIQSRSAAEGGASPDYVSPGESPENSLSIVFSRTSSLVRKLERDLVHRKQERRIASASVRSALRRAAQLEREKDKAPSAAMRISLAIDKVVWSMLSDGETFAEAEISNMILNVDRDFNNVGVARFTTKSFVVKNCVHPAKSNVLSAWNPPAEWGRNVMLRVDAKQGPPIEGVSLLEMFQVEIYPLKIHLTEVMYTMMWEYFFPGDEQDPQKRQQAWRGSTNTGTKRSRKGVAVLDSQTKESAAARSSAPGTPLRSSAAPQLTKSQKTALEHQRSTSLDKVLDDKDTEVLASDLALSGADDALLATVEIDATKSKDSRKARSGKAPLEDKKENKSRKIVLEIHNIKISQVELLVTYEGSKFSVSELRLLMDTFTRTAFSGSWRRLFSRVKKHIIWGVLKSVTGMQGKKFKDKMQGRVRESFQDSDSNSSDSGSTLKIVTRERFPIPIPHFSSAGEGFVSSIRGLFNSQKKSMMRTIRGEDAGHERGDGDLASRAPSKGKSTKLLRRHSKKRRSISKGSILLGDRYCPSPRASSSPYHSGGDSSSGSSTYEDFDAS